MSERWLPVVGFEQRYEVSDRGHARSVPRVTRYKDGRSRAVAGTVLTEFTDPKGYVRVGYINHEGKHRTMPVHQWVAAAFLGPCPEGLQTCHNDGNQQDSRPTNLRYDTPAANNRDLVKHGAHHMARRDRCKRKHLLVAPNLADHDRPDRRCLACHQARTYNGWLRRQGRTPIDLDALADEYYRKLMAGSRPS